MMNGTELPWVVDEEWDAITGELSKRNDILFSIKSGRILHNLLMSLSR
jgi:hypothetical protein